MFVGHYGISFAAKRVDKTIPLWTLFLAVQLLEVGWGVFVPLGIEKVRIVPAITATNPLDPPPPNDRAAAVTALVSYALFAAVASWLDRRRA